MGNRQSTASHDGEFRHHIVENDKIRELTRFWNALQVERARLVQTETFELQQDDSVPRRQWKDAGKKASSNAQNAAEAAIPFCTGLTLFVSIFGVTAGCKSFWHPTYFIGGLIVTPFAIAVDTVKAVVALPAAGEEKLRSEFCFAAAKIAGPQGKDDPQVQALYTSFLLRFRELVSLLVHLGVETEESLQQKIQRGANGGASNPECMALFMLTFLLTAWQSRCEQADRLLLANGKYLIRRDCPRYFLEFFDAVVKCRRELQKCFPHDHGQPLEDRHVDAFIRHWLLPMRTTMTDPQTTLDDCWNAIAETAPIQSRDKAPIQTTFGFLQKMRKAAEVKEMEFLQLQRVTYETLVSREQIDQFYQQILWASTHPATTNRDRRSEHSQISSYGAQETQIIELSDVNTTEIEKWRQAKEDRGRQAILLERKFAEQNRVCERPDDRYVIPERYFDVITQQPFGLPVRANDGQHYDITTAYCMKAQRQRGVCGIVITGFEIDKEFQQEIDEFFETCLSDQLSTASSKQSVSTSETPDEAPPTQQRVNGGKEDPGPSINLVPEKEKEKEH